MSETGSSSSASSSSTGEELEEFQINPPTTNPGQSQPGPPLSSIDPSFFQSTNPSSSQPTELPLSSFSNNNLFTQNTQITIPNTQASTLLPPDSNSQQHVHKSAPLTAPTRSWISQRVAKTIHIDEDTSNRSEDSQKMQLDQNNNNPSASSQRIIELGIVEEQLSQLLSLASEVLGSLTPPLNQDQSSTDQAIENFSASIGEYFELLNKIQLGLRTSMAHLRVGRISTRILFEPAHVRVPNCPVGLGNVRLDNNASASAPSASNDQEQDMHEDGSALSLGSLVAERNAWKDFVDSLESIKALRSLRHSDSSIPSQ